MSFGLRPSGRRRGPSRASRDSIVSSVSVSVTDLVELDQDEFSDARRSPREGRRVRAMSSPTSSKRLPTRSVGCASRPSPFRLPSSRTRGIALVHRGPEVNHLVRGRRRPRRTGRRSRTSNSSLVAGSRQSATSSPGGSRGALDRRRLQQLRRCLSWTQAAGEPPSSPTAVAGPSSSACAAARRRPFPAPISIASARQPAPTGAIMNSWKSDGVVRVDAAVEHVHARHRQQVRFRAARGRRQRRHAGVAPAARAFAIDTPRIALAPSRDCPVCRRARSALRRVRAGRRRHAARSPPRRSRR